MERNPVALIGFSANTEDVWVPKPADGVIRKIPAEREIHMGGTSMDVGATMRALGISVRVLGAVGRSAGSHPFNEWLAQQAAERGISFRGLEAREGTAAACVLVGGDRRSFAYKPPILEVPETEIQSEAGKHAYRYFVVTGLVDDPLEIEMAQCMWEAGSGKEKHVLNANLSLARNHERFREILGLADLLVVNHLEAAAALGIEPGEVNLGTIARFHDLGPTQVIVTCDTAGALYSGPGGITYHQGIVDVGTRYDETGAGDCFLGAFLTAEIEGKLPAEALRFAACAAGLKVLRPGGVNVPSRDEVDSVFARRGA